MPIIFTSKSSPTRSIAMLVLLTVIWGGTFPATKTALELTDPIQLIALRFWLAIIVMLPFLKRLRRSSGIDVDRGAGLGKEVWVGGSWVGLWLFVGYVLQTVGMKYTTASRSGFFTGLLVVLTPIAAYLFRTSKVSASAIIAVPVSLFGVYLLADPKLGALNIGDWLTIGCAAAFALQMVSLESVVKRVKDIWGLTFVQMLTLGVGSLIWALIEHRPFAVSGWGWLAVIYTGIFGSIIATYLQTRYQPEISAGSAALIFALEPVFAGLFAFILLHDPWSLRSLVGALVILAAMIWSGRRVGVEN